MAKKKSPDGDLASNRKAFHHYEVLETFEAGIVLLGTEIKSLRDHGGNLQDAYVLARNGIVTLKNASIALYRFGGLFNHDERRERRLLLHKREIQKLEALADEKGLNLIPIAIYLKNGRAKVKVAACKAKKLYDKRASIKEREAKRDVARALKQE